MRRIRAAIAAIVVLSFAPVSASALPRGDADQSDVFFSSTDGTRLHALVLRPAGMSPSTKTPVIVSVGPYFSTGVEQTPDQSHDRFTDFLDLTDVLARGYTYVMVDLPGFGGSSGCNDWGGVREQGAVKAAVEWAARQRWSTGRVALFGKSYDAWTGLMGIAHQPRGLAAVVAMEPVYSGYRYLYTNGVRLPNHLGTPAVFQAYDAAPGDPVATEQFINGLPHAWCYGPNIVLQQQDAEDVAFWRERNLLPVTKGKRTPIFLTQGFLESNTKPDATFEFFTSMAGPKRAWFGQFDHVRGWQKTEGGDYETGRKVFVKELVRFLDHHLKGKRVPADPTVAVQDNLGRYRGETRWPPPDAKRLWSDLRPGTYRDDLATVTIDGTPLADRGVWTFSQRAPHDAWLAGEPVLDLTARTALPNANLVAHLYDVSGSRATLVSRGAMLLRGTDAQRATFKLYGQDWIVRKGHRVGVLVSGADNSWWEHIPTGQSVSIDAARIGLTFLTKQRRVFLDGTTTRRLDEHLNAAVEEVSPETVRSSTRPFRLPGRLR